MSELKNGIVKIGKYVFVENGQGGLPWVEHEDGEGMSLSGEDLATFEWHIKTFLEENF